MIRITALILLALVGSSAAATTYKWIDADGTVHYSDVPREGAEEIELRGAQSYSAPRPPAAPRPRRADEETPPETIAPNYTAFEITTPAAEQTLHNIGGVLQVSLNVAPGLAERHGVTLFFDGLPVNERPRASTAFMVSDVFRGTHTLRATISDAQGRHVASTDAITFYVRQTSIQGR